MTSGHINSSEENIMQQSEIKKGKKCATFSLPIKGGFYIQIRVKVICVI